ncbi:hypothetical protein SU48_01675 [Deinococcus puniceus]|uniref:Integrase n=2 Tax=Deinococcus puniceus TaxID=1182568 RepID=A0A172T6W1_9DEIO|nr:hypothetical protein SU48_01675 [Deinococcus puniceus]
MRKKGQPSKGWKGAVTVGVKPSGALDRRWVSGKTRQEVLQKKQALEAQVSTGLVTPSEGMTLQDWLMRWAEMRDLQGVKPNTLRSYRDTARLSINPYLGKKRLDRLQPADVQGLLLALKRDQKSVAGLRYTLRVLKMALRSAVELQLIPRSVAEAVRAPKREEQEMRVWTPVQARQFMTVANPHRLGALFHLALTTGMRRGELLGLQWADIDWEASRITVRHSLIEVRRESEGRIYRGKPTVSRVMTELSTPKTKKSRRTIRLSPGTVERLREHQNHQRAEAAHSGLNWKPQGAVFASEAGTYIDPRNLYRDFRTLITQAEVPTIRLHDLRHTAASLMILRGVPPKTVSERLGHADVGFTLQVYTHLYDEQKDEAVFELEDVL